MVLAFSSRPQLNSCRSHTGSCQAVQLLRAANGGRATCSSSSSNNCRLHTGSCQAVLLPRVARGGRATCRSSNNNNNAAHSFDDDAASGLGKLRFNKRESELPKELQGLEIREDGFLVDTKTGKVINEFGATRFDVAVRALRGELDPAPWVENTERNPGVLLSKLVSFPTPYTFQVVGKPTPDASGEDFVADMVSLLSKVCEADIPQEQVKVAQRLGGKYVSVSVEVVVRAPEVITKAYEEIGRDSRVKMKF